MFQSLIQTTFRTFPKYPVGRASFIMFAMLGQLFLPVLILPGIYRPYRSPGLPPPTPSSLFRVKPLPDTTTPMQPEIDVPRAQIAIVIYLAPVVASFILGLTIGFKAWWGRRKEEDSPVDPPPPGVPGRLVPDPHGREQDHDNGPPPPPPPDNDTESASVPPPRRRRSWFWLLFLLEIIGTMFMAYRQLKPLLVQLLQYIMRQVADVYLVVWLLFLSVAVLVITRYTLSGFVVQWLVLRIVTWVPIRILRLFANGLCPVISRIRQWFRRTSWTTLGSYLGVFIFVYCLSLHLSLAEYPPVDYSSVKRRFFVAIVYVYVVLNTILRLAKEFGSYIIFPYGDLWDALLRLQNHQKVLISIPTIVHYAWRYIRRKFQRPVYPASCSCKCSCKCNAGQTDGLPTPPSPGDAMESTTVPPPQRRLISMVYLFLPMILTTVFWAYHQVPQHASLLPAEGILRDGSNLCSSGLLMVLSRAKLVVPEYLQLGFRFLWDTISREPTHEDVLISAIPIVYRALQYLYRKYRQRHHFEHPAEMATSERIGASSLANERNEGLEKN